MRPIWSGAISFGLVSIPVSLFTATRREDLKFRLLRASDLSPVNYKRVAEADGKEVPWDQIVKGYEHEKGKFVVIKDEDFKRVDIEATQTVDIIEFVKLAEVDPLLFYKPYYMEVRKGGDKAYTLLRESLEEAEMIAIAKVVIKTRQHLAAIKPQKRGLMLEIMHFPKELIDASEFKQPTAAAPTKNEIAMARKLIESMTATWDPSAFNDDYLEMLQKVIDAKIKAGDKKIAPTPKKTKTSNVIDLSAVLQESLKHAQTKRPAVHKAKRKAA
jgi:DNA end-binding protein Ku